MRNLIKFTGILFVAISALTSCSKDDDPADNDVFVGTYNGKVTYSKGTESKTNDNGNVRAVKVGNNYNFVFSDGIPDLNGVEFSKDANSAISIGSTASQYITIDAHSLKIVYLKDGANWTANCTR